MYSRNLWALASCSISAAYLNFALTCVMRCGSVFVIPIPCAFLRLAVEQVPTFDLAPRSFAAFSRRLELSHQFGYLSGHRGHRLVDLAELFRECGETVRQFGILLVRFLTGDFHLFHALTLVDGSFINSSLSMSVYSSAIRWEVSSKHLIFRLILI